MARFRNAPKERVCPVPDRCAQTALFAAANAGSPFFLLRIIVLKLHQESSNALNTITSYGDGFVAINLERHEGSVIVMPEIPVAAWPVASFDALTPEHFDALVEAAPEVVIFGSGSRLRFPHPRLTAQLAKRRIGVETMDFGAACRTYNILMSEGRRVAAALLIEA
ncbi:hypothetical protein NOV72_03640 [Caballeronia novacaledonica]|uniref:Xcc1710-like domain-containing protein n=1 Tax=Caballeronia novacaledonica TaxID=1544861 RepID=A0A2U3I8C5_9BURK|nr:hypothetical protein NOV72_03640 [Caballeronia novacaledonica]